MSLAKLSPERAALLSAATTAQTDYVRMAIDAAAVKSDAEASRQSAFLRSAIAHFHAKEAGVPSQRLADANKEAVSNLPVTAPKGTAYSSVAAVDYHSTTGSVLVLPVRGAEGDTFTAPTAVQTVVIKALRSGDKATAKVRALVRKSSCQEDAVTALRKLAEDAKEAATPETFLDAIRHALEVGDSAMADGGLVIGEEEADVLRKLSALLPSVSVLAEAA